jgi:hypothetical protein
VAMKDGPIRKQLLVPRVHLTSPNDVMEGNQIRSVFSFHLMGMEITGTGLP